MRRAALLVLLLGCYQGELEEDGAGGQPIVEPMPDASLPMPDMRQAAFMVTIVGCDEEHTFTRFQENKVLARWHRFYATAAVDATTVPVAVVGCDREPLGTSGPAPVDPECRDSDICEGGFLPPLRCEPLTWSADATLVQVPCGEREVVMTADFDGDPDPIVWSDKGYRFRDVRVFWR